MSPATLTTFRRDAVGTFVDRPNRFVVRVALQGQLVLAHCPNPGRLSELLFPGDPVVLERAREGRKLGYTAVAVERIGPGGPTTVPLVSVRANPTVGQLVLPLLFPGAPARPEVTLGSSRFDWAVDWKGQRHLLEVKACSEVEYDSALFPDAPSLRARKHLEELAAWGDRGDVPHVIFVVVHGNPRWFGPNIHTDPGFARALNELAPRLTLHAVVVHTDPEGNTRLVNPALPIVLPDLQGADSGLVVTLSPEGDRWSVAVHWYAKDWERAIARFPARRSFSIHAHTDRRKEVWGTLAALASGVEGDHLVFLDDPRRSRPFVDAIMAWRHQS